MYYYPQQQQPNYAATGAYMQPQLQIQQGLKGRPVSSLEEVRAAQIDFDGSLFVFPDIANKRIYTKQINLDGTANLSMYELASIPTSNAQSDVVLQENFVTRDEFEKALVQIKDALTQHGDTKATPPQFNF